jgi:nucleoside-diphosphate-sugar epimerase
MPAILVTGALGNVGRKVVRACAERGMAVRPADLSLGALAERFPGRGGVRLDFLDRATYGGACRKARRPCGLRPVS